MYPTPRPPTNPYHIGRVTKALLEFKQWCSSGRRYESDRKVLLAALDLIDEFDLWACGVGQSCPECAEVDCCSSDLMQHRRNMVDQMFPQAEKD